MHSMQKSFPPQFLFYFYNVILCMRLNIHDSYVSDGPSGCRHSPTYVYIPYKSKVLLKLYFVLYAEVRPSAGTNDVVHTAKTTTAATMALFCMNLV